VNKAGMSQWKAYKLGEFTDINPRVSLKQGNEYSFVEMKDLNATFKYVSPSAKRELKGGSKFQNGDTLFARITPCLENGKICQVKNLENNVGFGSTEFLVFRGKENLSDNDFVYYLSRSEFVKNNAVQMMTGTSGRQRVEKSALEQLEITAPDLPTQRQIAQILTSLDDKIELNLQMNQTLEAMAQAIFKEWFVNFNFPGFDGELVDGLPKGWRMGKLGEEFNLIMGQSPPGTSYNEIGEGMVFYQGRTDFGFRFPTNRLYTTEPKRIAKPLDTLVSVRAPVGDINMANEICCVGRGLSSVRHKSDAYSFTYYMMKYLEPVFNGFEGEGTVFGSINKTNFESIEIIVPSDEIVSEFEIVANPIDDKILENTKQIESLTQTRDTLLPKLMSGQLEIA
jgi:type I restriction enzyme S subunit